MKRKKVPIVFSVIILLYLLFFINEIFEVKKIRRLPQKSQILSLMKGELPHDIICRALLFKKGTTIYHEAIRPWIYSQENPLSDTIWNRFFLENDIRSMSSEDISKYLPYYPLSISDNLFDPIVNAISDGYFTLLPFLDSFDQGAETYNVIIKNVMLENKNVSFYNKWLPYLFRLKNINIIEILNSIYKKINDPAKFIKIFDPFDKYYYIAAESPNFDGFIKWLENKIDSHLLFIDTPILSKLLGFCLLNEKTRVSANRLISKYLDINDDTIKNIFFPICPNDNFPLYIEEDSLKKLFINGLKNISLSSIPCIIRCSSDAAELVGEEIVKLPDSEFRKGALVYLARNHIHSGLKNIDYAFIGNAHRTVMFFYPWKTCAGYSKAIKEYEDISGHLYDDVGKRWPPYYGYKKPSINDSSNWLKFIKKYPHFFGTDDAYYRLAYTYFMFGDMARLRQTINEYRERNLPDKDADPYIDQLVNIYNLEVANNGNIKERIKTTDELQGETIGWWGYGEFEAMSIEILIESIDWLIRNSYVANEMRMSIREVYNLRLLLEQARKHCSENFSSDGVLPKKAQSFAIKLYNLDSKRFPDQYNNGHMYIRKRIEKMIKKLNLDDHLIQSNAF